MWFKLPKAQTSTGLWPVRNQATQQEVRGQASEQSFICIYKSSHHLHYHLSSTSCQINSSIDSYRSMSPTVNCACQEYRLWAPYENLMPDDLRWSWGGDASPGEWLQIQIIISREVGLYRDNSKSISCGLISKCYQWAASDKLHLVAVYKATSYPGPWKNCVPWSQSLVPKRLETTALHPHQLCKAIKMLLWSLPFNTIQWNINTHK